MGDPALTIRRDPYAAFRLPNYRAYVIGWVVAMVGTRIQSVAIGWEMYQRTGDPLALGLVGLAQALPTMLGALPAGYLADRFDRTKLVMVSLFFMMVTSLALAVLSYTRGIVSLMYLFLFLDATAAILGRPARTAMIPNLVPAAAFPNAVMWNTSLNQITGVVGPALGGVVVAFSVPFAYVLAAASSVVFMWLLSRMEFSGQAKPAGAASFQGLIAGMEFVWRKKIVLTMISLDMFAVLLGGAVYLLPVFAEDILKVGATGFGWLRAAPAIGAFAMALLLVYLPPMQKAGRTLLWSVAAFGAATIVFGLTKSFWVALIMLSLTGAFDNVSMVIRGTLIQILTPDAMRGRVSAVNSIFIGASNELGGLESGIVAHWFGPIFSVVSGGIGTLVVVALTAVLSPELRRFGALAADEPTPDATLSAQPAAQAAALPASASADD